MFFATSYYRHQKSWPVAAALVLAAFLLNEPLSAGGNPPETLSLYVNVEKNGGIVTGLGPANFRLYQDGQPQQFRLEKPEEPASIALLVEHSRSSAYFIDDINAAMSGFMKYALEDHWYGLAAFSHGLEIPADFTKLTGRIAEAYAQLGEPMWNEIDTYDAVFEVLDKMARLPGRRVLIVVGSGADTFSERRLEDVQKKTETENVTIFVAGVGSMFRGSYEGFLSPASRMTFVQAQAFLRMLASKSGGFAWFPNLSNAFADVMQGIMQSIAAQYRIVYAAPARGSGKFHKIKVEAFRALDDKREDFKVLAREGWG